MTQDYFRDALADFWNDWCSLTPRYRREMGELLDLARAAFDQRRHQEHPTLPVPTPSAPGSKCGQCGLDFERSCGYVCGSSSCPLRTVVLCG